MCSRPRRCWRLYSAMCRRRRCSLPPLPWRTGGPPARPPRKTRKNERGPHPTLGFVENPDILAMVAKSSHALEGDLFCVGFAAESHDLLAHATAKRARKGVPLLVGNIGPATFGQDDNALLLADAQGHRELPRASKRVLAQQLIGEIAARLSPVGS